VHTYINVQNTKKEEKNFAHKIIFTDSFIHKLIHPCTPNYIHSYFKHRNSKLHPKIVPLHRLLTFTLIDSYTSIYIYKYKHTDSIEHIIFCLFKTFTHTLSLPKNVISLIHIAKLIQINNDNE